MAIEINYNSEFEYLFSEAYSKIENVRIDVMRDICWTDIRIYANKAGREANANGVGKKTIQLKYSELDFSFKTDQSKITLDDIKKACYNEIVKNALFEKGKNV